MSSPATTTAIARSASRLRIAVFACMAVMILLYLAARLGFPAGIFEVRFEPHGNEIAQRWIGDVSLVLLIIALFRLTQMLGRIAAGDLFTVEVIARFRSFAFWLLVGALFALLAPVVVPYFVADRGTDSVVIEMRVDFRNLLAVGVTLVLFLLARLLERAQALDEEVREFI